MSELGEGPRLGDEPGFNKARRGKEVSTVLVLIFWFLFVSFCNGIRIPKGLEGKSAHTSLSLILFWWK